MSVPLPPFQRLVDAHWRDVARLAAALAHPDDAPDVAQQAWLQAYAAYPSLTSTRNLRGWLLTITHRCAMDAHRANARRPVPTEHDALPDRTHNGPGNPSPSSTTSGLELTGTLADPQLWAAVRALPERQRHAVILRYVADLDHAAIAATLATSPAMSRRLVSDGVAVLRKALTDD